MKQKGAILPWLLLILSTRSALATTAYAGSSACKACHPAEYEIQTRSHHAQALRPMAESPLAANLLTAQITGLQYRLAETGVSVTSGQPGKEVTASLEWAFGAGAQGMTPVGQIGGGFLEHQYSYYTRARKLAPTFGHPAHPETPLTLLGLPQSKHVITTCFQCHATGVEEGENGPDLTNFEAGVGCERCHGPGRQHIEFSRAGADVAHVRRSVVNPGRLAAKAQAEFCGQCHRIAQPGNASEEPELEDPVAIRFAPVGLMASRCFTESKTLTCTTCHDAHQNAQVRSAFSYNQHCQACHSPTMKVSSHCPRAYKTDCLNCHMKQASLGPYLQFTNHRIRIY